MATSSRGFATLAAALLLTVGLTLLIGSVIFWMELGSVARPGQVMEPSAFFTFVVDSIVEPLHGLFYRAPAGPAALAGFAKLCCIVAGFAGAVLATLAVLLWRAPGVRAA